MHTLGFQFSSVAGWKERKKNAYVYIKLAIHFSHVRSMRDLQLTMNEWWGCCTPPQRSSQSPLLFELRVQYWRWKITSATMTTVNHIELGHGHRRLHTHTHTHVFVHSLSTGFYLQFAAYKNSTKAIPSSIGSAAINVQIFTIFIRLQLDSIFVEKKRNWNI